MFGFIGHPVRTFQVRSLPWIAWRLILHMLLSLGGNDDQRRFRGRLGGNGGCEGWSKPTADSNRGEREKYISSKYKWKAFHLASAKLKHVQLQGLDGKC